MDIENQYYNSKGEEESSGQGIAHVLDETTSTMSFWHGAYVPWLIPFITPIPVSNFVTASQAYLKASQRRHSKASRRSSAWKESRENGES